MRVAAVQFFATPFDLTRNLETVERLARQAAAQGARLIVLPELFNNGYVYTQRLTASAEGEDGATLRFLANLSAELKAIIGGTLLLRENGRIFNTFALVEPNGKIHKYRKQFPFLWEHLYFDAGNAPLIAETELGRIGLMTCWDLAHRCAWESYRGRADILIIASAPPRFHLAVLNFPLGKKIYLAQMVASLLRDREAIDRWYFDDVASGAAQYGLPVVHAVMSGRFVTEVPLPRLSFFAAALTQPKLWPLAGQAHLATLRATFYGTSAIFSAEGETLAKVDGEEGVAVADVDFGAAHDLSPPRRSGYLLPKIPFQLRLLEWLMKMAGGMYRR